MKLETKVIREKLITEKTVVLFHDDDGNPLIFPIKVKQKLLKLKNKTLETREVTKEDILGLKDFYAKELAYLIHTDHDPRYFRVVTSPDIQDYTGRCAPDEHGFTDCELINDELGLELFGSSAYIIPKGFYEYEDDNDDDSIDFLDAVDRNETKDDK
jgi:hypothetical protein